VRTTLIAILELSPISCLMGKGRKFSSKEMDMKMNIMRDHLSMGKKKVKMGNINLVMKDIVMRVDSRKARCTDKADSTSKKLYTKELSIWANSKAKASSIMEEIGSGKESF